MIYILFSKLNLFIGDKYPSVKYNYRFFNYMKKILEFLKTDLSKIENYTYIYYYNRLFSVLSIFMLILIYAIKPLLSLFIKDKQIINHIENIIKVLHYTLVTIIIITTFRMFAFLSPYTKIILMATKKLYDYINSKLSPSSNFMTKGKIMYILKHITVWNLFFNSYSYYNYHIIQKIMENQNDFVFDFLDGLDWDKIANFSASKGYEFIFKAYKVYLEAHNNNLISGG